jgi:hypothetical protein
MSRIRVDVVLRNETDHDLVLRDQSVDHGDWTEGWEPPGVIRAHTEGKFHGEGNMIAGEPTTGTEGWVRYAIADGANGWGAHQPFPVTPGSAARVGAGVAVVARGTGHLDVFWVGPDGAIGSTWWDAAAGSSWGDHQPFPITPPGAARPGSPVVAVARTPDHLDVFWIGPDGAIGSTWWDAAAGSSWGDHQPFPVTPPGAAGEGSGLAAVARGANHLDVFWVGPDGGIGSTWWDAAAGSGWGDHQPFPIAPPRAARAGSAVAAVARTADHLDVFWIGPDGGIGSTWWDAAAGSSWGDHVAFGIAAAGAAGDGSGLAAVARTANHLDVFWVGPDGAIGSTWWDSAPGSSWGDHGAFPVTPPGAARAGSAVSAVARGADHLDVFWVGPDGGIGSTWWDSAPGSSWGDHLAFPIATPGASGGTGVAAVARTGDHLDVFWVGPDGAVGSTWWDAAWPHEIYLHFDSPLIESQYGNKYWEQSPAGYDLSHTGGQGHNAYPVFTLRTTAVRGVPGFAPSRNAFKFLNTTWDGSLPVVTVGYLMHRLIEAAPGGIGDVIAQTLDVVGIDDDFLPLTHADQGMCGGMSFAMRDYWENQLLPPYRTTNPASTSDPVYGYLRDRLVDSFDIVGGGYRFLLYMLPVYPNGDEGFVQAVGIWLGRSWTSYRQEWPKIKADLDAGTLSPVGLIQAISANPGDIGKHHQVLAYAYEQSASVVTLHLYDPNAGANDGVRLRFDIGDTAGAVHVQRCTDGASYQDTAISCFFRMDGYGRKYPANGWTASAARHSDSGLGAVARTPDHLDVFWATAATGVSSTWWDAAPGSSWGDHAPFGVARHGTAAPHAPATVVSRAPGHLDVFWTGSDGAVWSAWWDGAPGMSWGDHAPFQVAPPGAAVPGAAVAAVARTPDHLDVFWIGPDGGIGSTWWDAAAGSSWGDHQPFPIAPRGSAGPGSGLAAVSRGPNHLDVFWVGPDGGIGSTWWDAAPGGGWDEHDRFGIAPPGAARAGSAVAAVARTADHLDVFWVGPDGGIGSTWWDAAPGSSWGDHQPFGIAPGGAAGAGSGLVAVARTAEHLDVFWVGPGGDIASNWWDAAPGCSWGDHAPFGIAPPGAARAGSPLSAVSRNPEHLDVFWMGTDGAIGSTWWNSAPGSSWGDHLPFPVSKPEPGIHFTPRHEHLVPTPHRHP